MNKSYVLALLAGLAAVLPVAAAGTDDGYRPMLVEGRVWEYKGNGSLGSQKVFHHFFKIDGEREIGGQPYKAFKLYLTKEFSSDGTFITEYPRDDVRYVRETEGKVFGISPEYNPESTDVEFDAKKYEQCLYDFTLSEGDSWEYPRVSYKDESYAGKMNLTVHYDTPVTVNGTEYRVQRFDGLEPLLSSELRFIEGIGTTMYGSLADMNLQLISGVWDNSVYPGIQSELVSVRDKDGTYLYNKSERKYLPILEDGKSWVLVEKRIPMEPGEKEYAYYDVSVAGDITIDGRACKRVSFVARDENHSWENILYEENGLLCTVLDFGNGNYSFAPLIDMTLEKGDKAPIRMGDTYPLEVFPDDYVTVRDSGSVTTTDGVDRKVLDVTNGWTHELGIDGTEVWVEGIGCNGDIALTIFPKPTNGRWIYYYIDSCMKDGEVLFTKADFDKLLSKYTGIDETGYNESLTLTYTDGKILAVSDDEDVSLELYSLDGSLIGRTRSNDRAVLETSALPGGIYIAKATCGETTAVRKIAL